MGGGGGGGGEIELQLQVENTVLTLGWVVHIEYLSFRPKRRKSVIERKNKFLLIFADNSMMYLMHKLTCTVAPFPVSIVIRCHGAPWSFVVFHCTFVITATFVDEWEHAAIARCCSFPTLA